MRAIHRNLIGLGALLALVSCGQFEAEDPTTVISTWKNTSFCAFTAQKACAEGPVNSDADWACTVLGGEKVSQCPVESSSECVAKFGEGAVKLRFYQGALADTSSMCESSVSSSSVVLSSSSELSSSSSVAMVLAPKGNFWPSAALGTSLTTNNPWDSREAGGWYTANDSLDNGKSLISLKLVDKTSYSIAALDYTLDSTFQYAFAVAGIQFFSSKEPANLLKDSAICLVYTSEDSLEIILNGAYGNNDFYFVTIPKAAEPALVQLPFTAFKQEGWGTAIDLEVVLAELVTGIQFRQSFRNKDLFTRSTHAEIFAVGLNNSCSLH